MTSEAISRLRGVILPVVLVLFLALYVLGLTAGIEPEIALFRAGLAGVILALLGRVALWILSIPPRPRRPPDLEEKGQHVDVAVGDDEAELPAPSRTDLGLNQRRQGKEVADAAE